ncbi:hypothetical protein [Lacisediminihabitans sp.]|uniref:hypothetical protein n=1 Tax=Lacisediminihabitans sp. TaxID=2787631 RepID=UPI00374CF114
MDINLDLKLLEQLKLDLQSIVDEFSGADDFSDSVAEATGHDDLSDHVRDFAHKWNDKRKKMTEAVTALQQQVGAISEGFTQVDTGLAKVLESAAASTATNHPEAVPR